MPELEKQKQLYLLKSAVQRALRAIYGDRDAGSDVFTRMAEEVSKELLKGGVRIGSK